MQNEENDGWYTKNQAAEILLTSTRSIERKVKEGLIETRKQRRPNRSPEVLCKASDVEALKPSAFIMPTETQTPWTPARCAHCGKQILTAEEARIHKCEIPTADQLIKSLISAIPATLTPATLTTAPTRGTLSLPWVGLDEAADISGLTRRLIRTLISNGEIVAIKDGRTWKVSRESLLHWTPTNATKDPNSSSSRQA